MNYLGRHLYCQILVRKIKPKTDAIGLLRHSEYNDILLLNTAFQSSGIRGYAEYIQHLGININGLEVRIFG